MLSNWPAYFDLKTGTNSFYEVNYKYLALKCGVSFPLKPSNSYLKSSSNSQNSFGLELKFSLQTVINLIRDTLSQQQPWHSNKKISKFIDNLVAYTYIEEFYLDITSDDVQDLQKSPTFCFVIQRIVRLIKDVHLMCVYASKKTEELFKETRRILKEMIRGIRKRCLEFIRKYSQDAPSTHITEMLVAQFLQVVKFLVNFSKYDDHREYVSICSTGTSSSSGAAAAEDKAQDIWSMTDLSLKQAASGMSTGIMDTGRYIETIPSLMTLPIKSRNSFTSTLQDLNALEVLTKRKGSNEEDGQGAKSITAKNQIKRTNPMTGILKGIRRKTAGNQDRPDGPAFSKDGNMGARAKVGIYGDFSREVENIKFRRTASVFVLREPGEDFDQQETAGLDDGYEFGSIIEEESGEMSPKKGWVSGVEGFGIRHKETRVIANFDKEVSLDGELEAEGTTQKAEENSNKTHILELARKDSILTYESLNTKDVTQEKREEQEEQEPEQEQTPGNDGRGRKIERSSNRENAVKEMRKSLLGFIENFECKTIGEQTDKNKGQHQEILDNVEATTPKQTNKPKIAIRSPLKETKASESPSNLDKKRSEGTEERSPSKTYLLKTISLKMRSISPKKRRRSLSLEKNPTVELWKRGPPEAILKEIKKEKEKERQKESLCFKHEAVDVRRKNFLGNLFGKSTKKKIEKCFDSSYGFCATEELHLDDIHNNIHQRTERGKIRLACVPYTIPESWDFFAKARKANGKEAEEGQQQRKKRSMELWDKLRAHVKTKTLLRDFTSEYSIDDSLVVNNGQKMLSCIEKDLEVNIAKFIYRNSEDRVVKCIGPIIKKKELKNILPAYNRHYTPENKDWEITKDLEVSLMLARLSYRKSRWRHFSVRSMSRNGSIISKEGSRDNSRDESRDNSVSLGSLKIANFYKSLGTGSSPDTFNIFSPTNRSRSDSREGSMVAVGPTIKPSLFKTLLRLNPTNDSNVPSPRTWRSRASSRESVKEASSASNPNTSSCPKKPSLFKSLFKINNSGAREGERSESGIFRFMSDTELPKEIHEPDGGVLI